MVRRYFLLCCLLCVWSLKLFSQAPIVNSYSPVKGPAGSSVTIHGSNFNTTAGGNIVFFGGAAGTVTSASATQLTVTVPAGATYQPLSVLNSTNGLTGYSAIPFIVTNKSAGDISATEFDPLTSYTTNFQLSAITLTDIDGDGKLDIVALNLSTKMISFFRNRAESGSLAPTSLGAEFDLPAGTNPKSFALQDIDGDGKPDLIVLDGTDSTVSVFHNRSVSGAININSFGPKMTFAVIGQAANIVIGDIDGDGRPDIVVSNGTYTSILLNQSRKGVITGSSFSTRFNLNTNIYYTMLADFDGDGKIDLAGTTDGGVLVFHNNISVPGSVTAASFDSNAVFSCGPDPKMICAADINGDGKPDILTINYDDATISLIQNTAVKGVVNASSFMAAVALSTDSNPTQLAVGDIDGDGLPDIVSCSYFASAVSIFRNIFSGGNISTSSFTPKFDLLVGYPGVNVALGDMDGDGRPDIATTVSNDGHSLSLIHNAPAIAPIISSFSPVAGPVGTVVTITGKNFDTTSANNVVYFGAIQCKLISATSTSLQVAVPVSASYQNISVSDLLTRRSGYSIRPFDVTSAGQNLIKPVDFPQSAFSNISSSSFGMINTVALGDMDGDGKPDLLLSSQEATQVSVFLNNGAPYNRSASQFNAAVRFSAGDNISIIRIGDIDGDGKPDIIALNTTTNKICVLKNISTVGHLAFATPYTITTNYNYTKILLADMNMDGKLDIIVSDPSSSTITIIPNTSYAGNISFGDGIYINTNVNDQIAVGDIDGDGKPDLLLSNGSIVVLPNTSVNGVLSFGPPATAVKSGDNFNLVDLDGDGKLDLVVNFDEGNQIMLYKNLATPGNFSNAFAATPVTITTLLPIEQNTFSADVNGDGKPDIISINFSEGAYHSITIFQNTTVAGNLSFDDGVNLDTYGDQTNAIAIDDLDGDSKQDFVLATAGVATFIYDKPRAAPPVPQIATVSPANGAAGSIVTLAGSNFNPAAADNVVTFGDVNATVIDGNANSVEVTVPAGASYSDISLVNTANHLFGYWKQPFDLTFDSKKELSAADFDSPVNLSTGALNTTATLSDIDGDGRPDLVICPGSVDNPQTAIFRNISSGNKITSSSFAPVLKLANVNYQQIIMADLDGDGKPDMLLTDANNNATGAYKAYKNTSTVGEISFGTAVNIPVGSYAGLGAVADIDGDGFPDIIATDGPYPNFSPPLPRVKIAQNLEQQSPFSFGPAQGYAISSTASAICVADFDGDNKPDIITLGSDGVISMLLNKSTAGIIDGNSFSHFTTISTGINAVFNTYMTSADIDGDGKPDLIVTNDGANIIGVLWNTSSIGKISFAPMVTFNIFNPGNIFISDLDGDGRPDIVTSSASGMMLFRNLASPGSFDINSLAQPVPIASEGYGWVLAGDLNGDGKPDLINTSSSIAIYQNNLQIVAKPNLNVFAPLNAATGSIVTIRGSGFNNTTGVTFGGVPAESFKIASDNIITAIVAKGSSGVVSVSTPFGIGSLGGFVFNSSRVNNVLITPLADTTAIYLGSSGSTTIGVSELATISASTPNPAITVAPSNFDCSAAGAQKVTVSVTDAGSPVNPGAVSFNQPSALSFDAYGNMYVVDAGNYRLRAINPAGLVTTLAGNGVYGNTDGMGTSAGFATTGDSFITSDAFGDVFVTSATKIRTVSPKGVVATMGVAVAASAGLAVAPDGTLYVTNEQGGSIEKVSQTGASSAFVNGLKAPLGIAIADDGNIYVADGGAMLILKVATDGTVSTYAGSGKSASVDGVGINASFLNPRAVATDHKGNVYVTESQAVRKIAPDGTVTTIAGLAGTAGFVNGAGSAARFNQPGGLAVDNAGNVFVADAQNNCIRKIDTLGVVSTYAGSAAPGYINGSVGAPAASATSQLNVKVLTGLMITNKFQAQVLNVDSTQKAAIPDYTSLVTLTGNCTLSNVKISQSPVAGTILSAGAQTTVTIFAIAPWGETDSVKFIVLANRNHLLIFNPLSIAVYGSADLSPVVVPPAGDSVKLSSSDTSVAVIVGGKIHIAGAGNTVITANASGSFNVSQNQPLSVLPAVLTVSAINAQKAYGSPNPIFQLSYQGFVNNDNSNSLVNQPVITTMAVAGSNAGSYPIIVNSASSPNYNISYVSGTLTINPELLMISVDSATRLVGLPNPIFTINYKGFVNGDNANSLQKQPVDSTTAAINSPPGVYPVILSGAQSPNYIFSYLNSALTVVNTLPSENFNITITGATCRGTADGTIRATAAQQLDYTATLTGNSINSTQKFTDSLSFNNLPAGSYDLCFSVAGQTNYQQCFTTVVTQPADLSVYAAVDKNNNSVTLSMEGANQYNITLNGVNTTTTSNTITLALKKGNNNLAVSTDKACQGTIMRDFDLSPPFVPFPNPFLDVISINLGIDNVPAVTLDLFNKLGTKIYTRSLTNQSGVVSIDLSAFTPDVYMLKITTNTSEYLYKVIKQ